MILDRSRSRDIVRDFPSQFASEGAAQSIVANSEAFKVLLEKFNAAPQVPTVTTIDPQVRRLPGKQNPVLAIASRATSTSSSGATFMEGDHVKFWSNSNNR